MIASERASEREGERERGAGRTGSSVSQRDAIPERRRCGRRHTAQSISLIGRQLLSADEGKAVPLPPRIERRHALVYGIVTAGDGHFLGKYRYFTYVCRTSAVSVPPAAVVHYR